VIEDRRDDFDDYLESELREPDLRGAEFTNTVMESVGRRRRRRRAALFIGCVAGSVAALLLMFLMPASPPAPLEMTPPTIAATMILAAICGIVWIDTPGNG
jgi:peptidoglycan/LPS O-acetylase OafA/YrhL